MDNILLFAFVKHFWAEFIKDFIRRSPTYAYCKVYQWKTETQDPSYSQMWAKGLMLFSVTTMTYVEWKSLKEKPNKKIRSQRASEQPGIDLFPLLSSASPQPHTLSHHYCPFRKASNHHGPMLRSPSCLHQERQTKASPNLGLQNIERPWLLLQSSSDFTQNIPILKNSIFGKPSKVWGSEHFPKLITKWFHQITKVSGYKWNAPYREAPAFFLTEL